MPNFFFTCPNCQNEIKAQTEWIGQTAECPFCLKSCVVPEKLSLQKKETAVPQTEYQVLLLDIEHPQAMAEKLNAQAKKGWQVVSQSTIFLSETSPGILGLGNGERQEGILYTLKREKL